MRLTSKERIVLHLLEYARHAEAAEVPPSMTQEGVTNAAGIDLRHLSQYMHPLIRDGNVRERMAHVTGIRQRRKVYDLTDSGRIIAMRQPTASDLRLIVAIIKASTDLERIGDEVQKVALIAARLAAEDQHPDRYREIRHISRLVIDQVHDALHAFARLDAESALACKRRDLDVDAEYEAIQRQNITYMMENPRNIRRAIDTMWMVRSLERVGDHAKNICEYIVYAVHGKDIRHVSLDDAEEQIREFVARRNL